MKRTGQLAGIVAGIVLMAALGPAARGAAGPAEIGATLAAAAKYDEGQSTKPLLALERLINETRGRPELRAEIEKRLAAMIESDAPLAARQFACRMLWITGTDASVPALAKMLVSPDPNAAEIACYALNRHPGPAAGAALRDALGKAKGRALAAVITLLGDRRDGESVEAVAALARGSDALVADAAIAALGKIAAERAVKAIGGLREGDDAARRAAADHALLEAGQELAARGKAAEAKAVFEQLAGATVPLNIRRGALLARINLGGSEAPALVLAALDGKDEGLKAAAIGTLRTMPGQDVGRLFAEQLPKLPAPQQVLLLNALVDRGGPGIRAAVARATAHADAAVRIAALKGLGVIGDASSVPLLVGAGAKGSPDEAGVAAISLRMLRAEGVDAAILDCMKSAKGASRADLVNVLADRRAVQAVPAILGEAASDDAAVARAALGALGKMARPDDLPALVRLLVGVSTPDVRDEAERAVGQACRRAVEAGAGVEALFAALASAQGPAARASLLRVVGTLADDRAYKAVTEALDADNAEVKDAAVRGLAAWPDARALEPLLKILQTGTVEAHRVVALRGCVRLLGTVKDQPAEAARRYAQAMAFARRPEEKKLVLSGLAAVHHADALKIILPCLDDASVQAEAALAAVSVALHVGGPDTEAANAAMKKVAEVAKDDGLRTQARALIRQPPPPLPDVYLDTLAPAIAKSGNGSGKVEINRNCTGAPLRLRGVAYPRGIGEHAKADLVYPLKPEYKRFVCVVGLDDQVARFGDVRGSIVAKVYAGDKVLAETPVLRGGGASANVDVEVPPGAKALRLVVDDAGDGVDFDDADFVNAGFIVQGGAGRQGQ